MANYINKYQTKAAYDADSTKQYPNVSYIVATNKLEYKQEPIYRWHQIKTSECTDGGQYPSAGCELTDIYQRQISFDDGQTWENVVPASYSGDVQEWESEECGCGDPCMGSECGTEYPNWEDETADNYVGQRVKEIWYQDESGTGSSGATYIINVNADCEEGENYLGYISIYFNDDTGAPVCDLWDNESDDYIEQGLPCDEENPVNLYDYWHRDCASDISLADHQGDDTWHIEQIKLTVTDFNDCDCVENGCC